MQICNHSSRHFQNYSQKSLEDGGPTYRMCVGPSVIRSAIRSVTEVIVGVTAEWRTKTPETSCLYRQGVTMTRLLLDTSCCTHGKNRTSESAPIPPVTLKSYIQTTQRYSHKKVMWLLRKISYIYMIFYGVVTLLFLFEHGCTLATRFSNTIYLIPGLIWKYIIVFVSLLKIILSTNRHTKTS